MKNTKPVRIYTTAWCPYCHRALALLDDAGLEYEQIRVDSDPETRAWLRQATGQRTVPQIFFGEESIGGCSELEAIVRRGELKQRVAA